MDYKRKNKSQEIVIQNECQKNDRSCQEIENFQKEIKIENKRYDAAIKDS